MALDVYEAKHGPADPAKIKVQKIDGVAVKGVDVMEEKDVGVYEYIEESTNSVRRKTMLTDDDWILSKDQCTNVFNSVSKQLGSSDTACTVIGSVSSSSKPGSECDMPCAGAGVDKTRVSVACSCHA